MRIFILASLALFAMPILLSAQHEGDVNKLDSLLLERASHLLREPTIKTALSTNTPYFLDSTRYETVNEQGVTTIVQTSAFTQLNDSTLLTFTKLTSRSINQRNLTYRITRPQGFTVNEYIIDEASGDTIPQFIHSESNRYRQNIDNRFSEYLYFDGLGNQNFASYFNDEIRRYSDGTVLRATYETDSTFTNVLYFMRRDYTKIDTTSRTINVKSIVANHRTTDPFDTLINFIETTNYDFNPGVDSSATTTGTQYVYDGSPDRDYYTVFLRDTISETQIKTEYRNQTVRLIDSLVYTLNQNGTYHSFIRKIRDPGFTPSFLYGEFEYLPGTDLLISYKLFLQDSILASQTLNFYSPRSSSVKESFKKQSNSNCLSANQVNINVDKVEAPFTGNYTVYNTNGNLIQSYQFSKGNHLDIKLPQEAGMYILVGTSQNQRCVTKFVK